MATKPCNNEERQADPSVADEMNAGEDTAVATRQSFSVATDESMPEFSGQIKIPYLQLAYGQGRLSQVGFAPGSLVLASKAGDNLLYAMSKPTDTVVFKPLRIVLTNVREYWKEYRPTGESKFPKMFWTEAEAKAAGFTTEYNKLTREQPTAPKCLRFDALVAKPENVSDDMFCLPALGTLWSPVHIPIEKSSMQYVPDVIGPFVKWGAKTRKYKLASREWYLWTAFHETTTGYKPPAIQMKLARDLTDEQSEELLKVLSGT